MNFSSCQPQSSALVTQHCYFTTRVTRMSTIGGIVRPRALAVLRLSTNSNLIGCSTGMSAGFVPLRILSTKTATRLYGSVRSAP
ncbi:MAG: hypothetical protein HYU31_12865 [Deltaproteobacteria bacterium]|nr:hypothetical protein [Deltaproteobacteria bacterium]MBI2181694.1 hypothetical protein [Deltaproteobacteria bacterium]